MASNDILFVSNENGVSERKPAHKTGRLCVSYSNKYNRDTFKIYGILSHMPFIPNKFYDFYEAIEVAEYLEKAYDEYLEIWEADPSLDIPLVTRFTIPDGDRIFVALNKLEGQDIISKQDFFSVLNGEENVSPICPPSNHSKQTVKPKSRSGISSLISNFVSGFFH